MIEAYMVDDFTIVKYGGVDSWNHPLATSDVDVKGYAEFKTKLVKNLQGEEVIAYATFYFPENIDVKLGRSLVHEDIIKFNGVKYVIINIKKPKTMGFSGLHYEVFVA